MSQAYAIQVSEGIGYHSPVYTSLEVAKESLRLRHPEIEFFLTNETVGIWGMKLPDKEMQLKLIPLDILSKAKPY